MHPESLEYRQAEDAYWEGAQDRAYSVQARPGWWDVLAPDGTVVSTWNDPALAAEECRWLNALPDKTLLTRPPLAHLDSV